MAEEVNQLPGSSGTEDVKPAADSSTAAPGDSGAPPPPPDSQPGESSTPEGEKRPASSYEAVLALAKRQAAERTEQAKPAGDSPTPEPAGKAESAEPEAEAAEAEEPLRPITGAAAETKQGRRWNRLLGELKAANQDAQNFRHLRQWTQQNGLPEEDFAVSLEMAVLARRNPAEALKKLDNIRAALCAQLGIVTELPDDLRQDVSDGALNDQRARELAELRLREQYAVQRLQLDQQRRAKEQQEAQERARTDTVIKSLQDFEASQATDPDWNKIHRHFMRAMQVAYATEGIPATPEDARAHAREVLASVKGELRELMPQPTPISPTPGGSNPARVVAKPKSSMEAMLMVRNGHRP